MAIEINTSGYRKELDEPYPALNFLPLIEEIGLPVTFGSDAHTPEQVGFMSDEIRKRLAAFPLMKLARYRSRKLITYSLTGEQAN